MRGITEKNGYGHLAWGGMNVMLLLASSIAINKNTYEYLDPITLAIKQAGKNATYGLLLAVVLFGAVRVLFNRKCQRADISVTAFCVFVLLAGLKYLASGFALQSTLYFGTAGLYFFYFGLLLPDIFRRQNLGLDYVCRIIGVYHLIFVSANLVVSVIVWGFNLPPVRTGLLAFNPNMLGYSVAISSFCAPAIARALWKSTAIRTVYFLVIILCSATLVFYSGSRGALALLVVSTIIGVRATTPHAMMSFVVFLGIIFTAVISLPRYLHVFSSVFVTGRVNTREHIFIEQLQLFSEYPLFGKSWVDSRVVYGENSFLGVLSQGGLMLGIPFFLFVFAVFAKVTYLTIIQKRSDARTRLMVFGVVSAVVVGSFFEGLLAGVVSFPIFLMLLISSGVDYRRRLRPKSSAYRSEPLV